VLFCLDESVGGEGGQTLIDRLQNDIMVRFIPLMLILFRRFLTP